MSMLDVLASALGAFLILFLLMAQRAQQAQEDARAKDEHIAHLQERLQAAQSAYAAAIDALDKTQAALDGAQRDLSQARVLADQAKALAKQLDALGKGMAIGMCEVDARSVSVSVVDDIQPDGDVIELKLDERVLAASLELVGTPDTRDVPLDRGTSYLIVTALSTGTSGPNTAAVTLSPCRDGQPQTFKWHMKRGEKRHLSIVRR